MRLIVACLLITAGSFTRLDAAEIKAIVYESHGDVRITKILTEEQAASRTRKFAEPGDGLYADEVLVTGPESSALVIVPGMSLEPVRLGPERIWVAGEISGSLPYPGRIGSREADAVVVRASPDLREGMAPEAVIQADPSLPRYTRIVGMPIALDWRKEFPEIEQAAIRIQGMDGRLVYEEHSVGRVILSARQLEPGKEYRWALFRNVSGSHHLPESRFASGRFEILTSSDIEHIAQQLNAIPSSTGLDGADIALILQIGVLMENGVLLEAAKLITEEIERLPEGEGGARDGYQRLLENWLRLVSELMAG
ncbi:MAG: hypothetical protein WD081_04125 [Gammaproteobacteria bacterium]